MKKRIVNIILILVIIISIVGIAVTINHAKSNLTGHNTSQIGEVGTPPDMPNENSEEKPPEKPDGENGMTPPTMDNGMSDNTMNDSNSQSLEVKYYVLFGIESLVLSSLVMYLIMSRFNKKSIKETFSNGDKVVICILSIIILASGLTYLESKITTDYLLNNTNNKTYGNNKPYSSQSGSITYSGVKEITEDATINSGSFSSNEKDENAILVSGDINATLSNVEVTKTGDSDGGDNTSFYGTNSGIIAKSGVNLTLKNITVTTNASGANGVFSYGGSATTNNSSNDGTTITISDSKITTTGNNSGGIMTTGGGIMKATNLTINTAGVSSAAIRTDRGGGNVVVDKGTYKTTGQGSPTIYSTADITVKNADLIATSSEGVVIEGKNKVTLENVTLTDSNNKLNGKSTTYKNIFLYQSMSGDAADGISEFISNDSTITTNKGDTLYVTNTNSKITLNNNKIINNDKTGNFLRVQKDSWGNSGSNGGNVTLIMQNQKATGNIVIDSISTLDMIMKENSYYEGTINGDNSAKEIKLTLDKSTKIKLTGDSYLTSLDNADSTCSNIDFNGYKLYVNGKAIN